MERISTAFLDLRPVYFFTKVAEVGSFSRAAPLLGVGQPVLSKEIRRLEELYGATLLYRNGRGVSLTNAGQLFLSAAEEIIGGVARARRSLLSVAERPGGPVSIGMPAMLGSDVLLGAVRSFHDATPDASITIREGFCSETMRWLADGEIDLAILYDPPKSNTLLADLLGRDELMLVSRPDNAGDAMSDSSVALREVLRGPLLLPPEPHRIRLHLSSLARKMGCSLNVPLEIAGAASMLDLVRAGLGVTVLPYGLVQNAHGQGMVRCRPIAEPDVHPGVYLAYSPVRPATPAVQALGSAVRKGFSRIGRSGDRAAVYRRPAHNSYSSNEAALAG